ncbi:SprT family zinc-dependent metalloprotease [Sphingobacterium phlebotomi]|uniref:SprT family zinc-dependent metalloprotease n=1 Tax=Sphingobacterium phlebotomi TaxID=2605433 RepID=A0A5D4GYB0_9SPHI|nr:SprT-like domain-containing protein [Sphingobacterium phlebotomi]TYR33022.1 SprT family zinc-dependent metalloprotease [Sphingobacterium phlebotomi]
MPDFSKQLSQYMPEAAAPIISAWINDTGCQFRISRRRRTKLGDYTAPFRGAPHKISVNYDLNPYAFLVTTIHEFAHLQTWQQHKHRVKPHGTEWKNHYKLLMAPFLQLGIFPADIRQAIVQYMENPAASSCTDVHLYRTLRKYDENATEQLTIESIPTNSIFALENGRIFQKREKLRKRYKCIELSTDRAYLIHPIAEVILIEDAGGIKNI